MRLSFVVLFLLGTALNIIRVGVIFPLLAGSCMLAKFVGWLFADVIKGYGIRGETENIGKNFRAIGVCAPWMWNLVGFEQGLSAKDQAMQIIVQPANLASGFTGIKHGIPQPPSPCDGVECGKNAMCQNGDCLCRDGYVGDGKNGGTSCDLNPTKHGCVCLDHWKSRHIMRSSTERHGCPAKKRCHVDIWHETYATCSKIINTITDERIAGMRAVKDKCTPGEVKVKPVRTKISDLDDVPAEDTPSTPSTPLADTPSADTPSADTPLETDSADTLD